MLKLKNLIMVLISISFHFYLVGCAASIKKEICHFEQQIKTIQNNINYLNNDIVKLNEQISDSENYLISTKNEEKQLEDNIDFSKKKIASSIRHLKSNPDVFVNLKCVTPSHKRKPEPFCNSQTKAKEFGLSYCSMSAGCDVALFVAGEKLDSFSKRFLASEACSRTIHELNRVGYTPDKIALNALEALSDTGCSDMNVDGIFTGLLWLTSCTMSYSIKMAKIMQYVNCVDRETENCYENYLNWRDEPSKRRNLCQKNVSQFYKENDNLKLYTEKLKNEREVISVLEKRIVDYKAKLKEKKSNLLIKEKKLTKNRLKLKEKKDSIIYKLLSNLYIIN